jgi:tRNA (guanine37-N1)-methyltransferase
MRIDILSIFPEMFASPFECSLLQKAREKGLIEIMIHDIRHYAEDKHHMTDDAPYGGGGGMVMKVEPIDRALSFLNLLEGTPVILMTPQGETFNQDMAEELASFERLVLICGRYEGVDERVRIHLATREISIGDFILTGGEMSAMMIVDSVARLVPGVLGNSDSAVHDSFSTGLLEHPHYTRPSEYSGWKVPEVLLSGNHREIDAWRRRESLRRTRLRRPDLLKKMALSRSDLLMLEQIDKDQ